MGLFSGTILLIEADASLASIHSGWLENEGFQVICLAGGGKAIETVINKEHLIDLVLMDVDREFEGPEMAAEIPWQRDIPLLLLYSENEKESLKKTNEIASCGLVSKSSDETVLIASVKTALKLSCKLAGAKSKEPVEIDGIATSGQLQSQLIEILEKTTNGFFTLNRQWKCTYLNLSAGRIVNRNSEGMLGKVFWDEFPDLADTLFARILTAVMQTGIANSFEIYFEPLKTWYEISVDPTKEGISVIYRDISNKKRIEEELEKHKTIFEQMFVQSVTSTQILDKEGWCLRINPKLGELFGVKPEHIEGRVYNIFNDEEIKRHGIDKILEKVFNEKQTASWEINFDIGVAADSQHIEIKEKKKVWYSNRAYPIVDQSGGLMYVVIQHEDISERKHAEEALRESEELFRSTFDNATAGVCLTGTDGKFLRVNSTLCNMFGYTDEELRALRFNDITYPEDRQIGSSVLKSLINCELEEATIEKRYVRKNGEVFWASLFIAIVRESPAKPKYIITHVQDISENKNARELLKESEEQFRTLFENAVLGLYRTSPDGKIIKINQALCRMLGYACQEELMQKNLEREGFQPDYTRQSFKERFRGNNDFVCIESIWHKADGSVIFVRENARAVRDQSGEVLYYDGTVEDVTERKQAEEALIHSEKTYRLLFENNPLPMWIYDLDSLRFLEVNKVAVESYGYSREEFLKMTLMDIRPKEDIEALLQNVAATNTEYAKTDSWRHVKKNGEIIFVEIISHTIAYEGILARMVMANNITERKQVEEDLIRARKEAEKSDKLKSEFLAQMSHEIRSPISTMLNFVSLIKEEVQKPLSEEMVFSFNAIDSSSRRLIRTIDLILNMSQIQTGYLECNYQILNLEKDVLINVINEYSTSALLKGLSLNICNDYGSPAVNADLYTVTQIFSNLINNAIKYTKQGGIAVRIYRNEENYISVDVSDTGIGISEHYIEHIFTPFSQEEQGYTRKFEGNGLGLALVRKYCEFNNAQISVKSKKGEGSTFTVTFCRFI